MCNQKPATDPFAGEFKKQLQSLLNRHNIDGHLNIPDFILADYISRCLFNLQMTNCENVSWHGWEEYIKHKEKL